MPNVTGIGNSVMMLYSLYGVRRSPGVFRYVKLIWRFMKIGYLVPKLIWSRGEDGEGASVASAPGRGIQG